MPRFRFALSTLCAVVLLAGTTACADLTAPTPASAAFAKGSGSGGGGDTGGGTVTTPLYDGVWQQAVPLRFAQPFGYQENTTIVTLRQKGTTLTGTATRWATQYDFNGTMLVSLELDSSIKVSGTVTATGVSLVLDKIGESNQRVGFVGALSADGLQLTNTGNVSPLLGITALIR